MSVSNGQLANQTTFNSSFMSREIDTSTIGQVDLLNADAESGATVENIQRELNGVSAFTGRVLEGAFDDTPVWVNNDVGTSTDHLHARAEALTAAFDSATGHTHDGSAGEGGPIASTSLTDVRLRGYMVRGTDITAGGTSDVVTTEMSGKTASTGDTVKGVVVTGNNKVILRDATAATEDDQVRDTDGDLVFGRITESAGVWTLSYYTNKASIQTAYDFTSPFSLRWFYQELYNPITDAPIYNELVSIPSDNATQDVVDATVTQRGLVSASAQEFGGDKTFNDDTIFQSSISTEREDVASTATITALSSAKSLVKITGSTATEIQGITAGSDGQILTIHNGASALVTIAHEDAGASAANRIKLPSGEDLEISSDSSAEFFYDTAQSRWVQKSGSGSGAGGGALSVTGTRATPETISAAGGIAFTGSDARQMWFVEGDSAETVVSANPQIAVGGTLGQELILIGRNDAALLTLNDGTGLSLNGAMTLAENSAIGFVWDGTNWVELFRR